MVIGFRGSFPYITVIASHQWSNRREVVGIALKADLCRGFELAVFTGESVFFLQIFDDIFREGLQLVFQGQIESFRNIGIRTEWRIQ